MQRAWLFLLLGWLKIACELIIDSCFRKFNKNTSSCTGVHMHECVPAGCEDPTLCEARNPKVNWHPLGKTLLASLPSFKGGRAFLHRQLPVKMQIEMQMQMQIQVSWNVLWTFSHPQQGRIDFNTFNPSLSRGMDFLIHPCRLRRISVLHQNSGGIASWFP